MSGLLLTLAPNERLIVNGALLENGDRPSRIRIKDNDARVLRCSDAMRPNEIDTPVKRLYYTIQLIITGDLAPEQAIGPFMRECEALEPAFAKVAPNALSVLQSMVQNTNYYSALCHIRQLITLEQDLLSYTDAHSEQRVA